MRDSAETTIDEVSIQNTTLTRHPRETLGQDRVRLASGTDFSCTVFVVDTSNLAGVLGSDLPTLLLVNAIWKKKKQMDRTLTFGKRYSNVKMH